MIQVHVGNLTGSNPATRTIKKGLLFSKSPFLYLTINNEKIKIQLKYLQKLAVMLTYYCNLLLLQQNLGIFMKIYNCLLFNGISESQIKGLLYYLNAYEVKFNKGEEICSYNKNSNTFGIILNGKAYLKKLDSNGNFSILETLIKNSVFSDAISYTATDVNYIGVYAQEPTTVLFLDINRIFERQNACDGHSTFIYNLMNYVVNKSKMLSERIEILSSKSIKDKLLSYFSLLANNNKSNTFIVPMSYTNLAEYLCIDRSAMMREIKKLNDDGIILSSKRQVTIINNEYI